MNELLEQKYLHIEYTIQFSHWVLVEQKNYKALKATQHMESCSLKVRAKSHCHHLLRLIFDTCVDFWAFHSLEKYILQRHIPYSS